MYVDGELEPAAEQAFAGHVQSCTECSAAVLEQQELKKAVRVAAKRYSAPPELYASVRRQISPKDRARPWLKWSAGLASMALLAVVSFAWLFRPAAPSATVAQLIDQHITMLASANPYDVISQDPHTVKPWFQGKVPFTFNPAVPTDSPFKLLVYQVRQHKISVFIFQARDVHGQASGSNLAFTVNGWQQGGLQYYIVTDAAREDANQLRSLLEDANRS
jgi:anti-sigma factor RsiW